MHQHQKGNVRSLLDLLELDTGKKFLHHHSIPWMNPAHQLYLDFTMNWSRSRNDFPLSCVQGALCKVERHFVIEFIAIHKIFREAFVQPDKKRKFIEDEPKVECDYDNFFMLSLTTFWYQMLEDDPESVGMEMSILTTRNLFAILQYSVKSLKNR